jgi:selenocysteine-specific elongation factor
MLENIHQGSLDEQILHYVRDRQQVTISALIDHAREEIGTIEPILLQLENEDLVLVIRKNNGSLQNSDLVLSASKFQKLVDQTVEMIDEFHQKHPLRIGMLKEEVRTKLGTEAEIFDRVVDELVTDGKISEDGLYLKRNEHQIEYSTAQQEKIIKLQTEFSKAGYQPPSVKESIEFVGEDVYHSLLEVGELIQVSSDVVFRPKEYFSFVEGVKQIIQDTGSVTVAQVRDTFNTSRKYVLAVLEYMDSQGITKRVGDTRKLKSPMN